MNTPQQRGEQAVPEGWRLVPVEPTPKQIGDGIRALMDAPDLGGIVEPYLPEVVDAYKAMLTSAPPAPPAPSVGGWISVRERLPECDGETMFIGENEAGYITCFNRLTDDGYCFHDTAETSICVMSGLRCWKRVDRPQPPKEKP